MCDFIRGSKTSARFLFMRPNLFGIVWMVRRKMCVKPMEENEDDKVVSMIINYFSARVNIAKECRENLIEIFTRRKICLKSKRLIVIFEGDVAYLIDIIKLFLLHFIKILSNNTAKCSLLLLPFSVNIFYISRNIFIRFLMYIWKHIKFFNKCQSTKFVYSFCGLKEIQQIPKITK